MRGTWPSSVPLPAYPAKSFPPMTTAPPIPVPTVMKTTSDAPRPAPKTVSPSPMRFASFPIRTGRADISSSLSANAMFSQPLMFSAPPTTTLPVSSTIPGVPIPTPFRSMPLSAATFFTCETASASWPMTASADTSAIDGKMPSK